MRDDVIGREVEIIGMGVEKLLMRISGEKMRKRNLLVWEVKFVGVGVDVLSRCSPKKPGENVKQPGLKGYV